MRSFQWLDMFPDWNRGIERLAEAIRGAAPRRSPGAAELG